MNTEQHHTYSADDLLRYHRGELSHTEMHRLEKDALDDPFLSEALDGYALVQEKMKPLDFINLNSNSEKSNNTGKIIQFKKLLSPLRIAASLLLLFCIGYFLFSNNVSSTSTVKNNSLPEALSSDSNQTETITPTPQNQVNDFSTEKATELASIIKDKKSNKSSITVSESLNKPTVQQNIAATPSLITEDVAVAEYKADDDVTSISVDNHTLKKTEQKRALVTKDVITNSNDSQLYVAAVPTGKMKLPAPVITNNNNTNSGTWTNNGQALNEVVVTGYSTNRKKQFSSAQKTISAKELNDDENTDQVELPVPSPIIGWDELNSYLQKNLQSCTDKTGSQFKGKAIISFYIDASGTPVKIKSKSLSPNCLNEAKRLLLAGPKWSGDPNKKVTVTLEW